jgi:hypothetical protein
VETGCESTQMMGFVLPLDEMVVKKPGLCLPPIEPEVVTFVRLGWGDCESFHALTVRPSLLKTRGRRSVSTK